MWQDDDDRPPTGNELLRWEAAALGEQDTEAEWVLTNYDVWMRNPYYTGPRTEGHPDDHDRDCCTGHRCEEIRGMQAEVEAAAVDDDDIPF